MRTTIGILDGNVQYSPQDVAIRLRTITTTSVPLPSSHQHQFPKTWNLFKQGKVRKNWFYVLSVLQKKKKTTCRPIFGELQVPVIRGAAIVSGPSNSILTRSLLVEITLRGEIVAVHQIYLILKKKKALWHNLPTADTLPQKQQHFLKHQPSPLEYAFRD